MFYYKILYSIYAQWYIGIYFINLIGKMNLTTALIWIVLFSHPYRPFAFSFSDLTIISFTHFLVEYLTLSLSNFCSNLFTVIFYIQISKRLTWFLMDMCVEPIMLFQSIEVYEIALLHLSLTNVQQTEHSTILPIWKVLWSANIILFLLEPKRSIKYWHLFVIFSVVNMQILF